MTETGHASGTVSKVWHLYLAETSQDRRPELGLRREELLQRLERNAADARAGVEEARAEGNHSAACRYLGAETSALRRLAELEGLLGSPPSTLGAGPGTVENPLPWSDGPHALAGRVAALERDRAWKVAFADLYRDPLDDALQRNVPELAELVPVAVEALSLEP